MNMIDEIKNTFKYFIEHFDSIEDEGENGRTLLKLDNKFKRSNLPIFYEYNTICYVNNSAYIVIGDSTINIFGNGVDLEKISLYAGSKLIYRNKHNEEIINHNFESIDNISIDSIFYYILNGGLNEQIN